MSTFLFARKLIGRKELMGQTRKYAFEKKTVFRLFKLGQHIFGNDI
jgi:hypothetical protein